MNTALALLILTLVTAQRLGELVLARRNTARLLAEGGVEHSAGHYPVMVALHAAWLAGLWLLAWGQPVLLAPLAAYVVLQAFRGWILASLGRRWTTRIVTVPGETLVRRGPYRFLRHPNYALVALEVAILPMVFALWFHAALFTLLNAAMLFWRIRAEDRALATLSDPAEPAGGGAQ